MRNHRTGLVMAGLIAALPGVALPGLVLARQAAPAAPAPTAPAQDGMQAAPTVPAAVQGDQWRTFSHSATRSYVIELNHITHVGDVTGVRLARVPLPGTVGDYSHTLVEEELRCGGKTSRVVAETDFDAGGAAGERIETGEAFDTFSPTGLDGAVAMLVCDSNEPTTQPFASIKAYIDDGRK